MTTPEVRRLIGQVDEARDRVRALVGSKDAAVLNRRPKPDQWSILENVRHLLFAEQAHLGQFLPGGREWSPIGLTQRTGSVVAGVGDRPSKDVKEVFGAWDAVHAQIREGLSAQKGDIQTVLERHLAHLERHIKIIEKLLRKSAAG